MPKTEAQTGLRKALARAGGSVLAIAELPTSDLLAELSDEQKAELSAALAAPAPEAAAGMKPKDAECGDDGDEDDATGETDPEEEPGMKKKGKADAEPAADASDRVKAVAAAVANDDTCKGKADLALQMLADDDFAQLSASAMVKLLGKAPATTSHGSDEDGGKAMLAAIRAAGNASLGNADDSAAPQAEANHGWDNIHAEIRERRGR